MTEHEDYILIFMSKINKNDKNLIKDDVTVVLYIHAIT